MSLYLPFVRLFVGVVVGLAFIVTPLHLEAHVGGQVEDDTAQLASIRIQITLLQQAVASLVKLFNLRQAQAQSAPEPTFFQTHHDKVPNFAQTPTIVSLQDGNWSNVSTWSVARVPNASDVVLINHNIAYDTTIGDVDTIGIRNGGILRFSTTQSTVLKAANILVTQGGTLEVGTEANPIPAHLTAEIIIKNKELDTVNDGVGVYDPEQWGTSLLVIEGTLKMHGSIKTPTFVRVTQEMRAGSSIISLEQSPSGWRVGDRIIIPDTRQPTWVSAYGSIVAPQWEERTISTILGSTITVSSPLSFDHLGARDATGVLRFYPHVGNITRNVIIRSENENGRRGHTAWLHNANADVRYVQLQNLGRTNNNLIDNTVLDVNGIATKIGTNQIARYPFHTHHLSGPIISPSNGYQTTAIGLAIDNGSLGNSIKWGMAIHGTHYGLFQENIVYNVAGAGIVTEDASESFNVIEKNFVMRVRGLGGRADSSCGSSCAREGVGFWFRGPNNYVRDNVAANTVDSYGYTYFQFGTGVKRIPLYKGANSNHTGEYKEIDIYAMPLLEFARNEVYGAAPAGMTFWSLGTHGQIDPHANSRSFIQDLRMWHIRIGIIAYQTDKLTLANTVIMGDVLASRVLASAGMDFGDYLQKDMIIEDFDIQNMTTGIRSLVALDVRNQTQDGVAIVRDGYLNNDINISFITPFSNNSVQGFSPKRTEIRNVHFATTPSGRTRKNIVMNFKAGPTDFAHAVVRDAVYVYGYNGAAGGDFRVYYNEQVSTFITPETTYVNGAERRIGSPEVGLTNAQNWTKYGIAVAGAVAPCSDTTTHPEIGGITCLSSVSISDPSIDLTSPLVSLTAPIANATVSGASTLTATASDLNGVSRVDFYVDGVFKGTDTTSPYTYIWDTTNGGSHPCNGAHTHSITAQAYDPSNNAGISVAVVVNMNNPAYCSLSTDTTPPVVFLTPLANTSVSGTLVVLGATASDLGGVVGVQFLIDNLLLGAEDITFPYSTIWDTTMTTNGTHTLAVRARDNAGNTATSIGISVVVNNTLPIDTTPPTIPTALTGAAISSSQINFSWTPSTDANGIANYHIERCTGATCTTFTEIATTPTVTYSNTGLTVNTLYRYRVRASDPSGNFSPYSTIVTVTTSTVIASGLPAGAIGHYDFGNILQGTVPNRIQGNTALPSFALRGLDYRVSNGEIIWNENIGSFTHMFPYDSTKGTYIETVAPFPNLYANGGTVAVRFRMDPSIPLNLAQASSVGLITFRPYPDQNIHSFSPHSLEIYRAGPGSPVQLLMHEGAQNIVTNINGKIFRFNDTLLSGSLANPLADKTAIIAWDPQNMSIYIDGVLATTSPRLTPDYGAAAYQLMVAVQPGLIHSGDNQFYKGAIENLLVYDRALNGVEVASVHQVLQGTTINIPTLSTPQVSNITNTNGTISWTTNIPASSRVHYFGIGLKVAGTEQNITTGVTSHTITLANLTSCTTYNYVASSRTATSQSVRSAVSSFTTTGCLGNASIINSIEKDIVAQTQDSLMLPTTNGRSLKVDISNSALTQDVTLQIHQLATTTIAASAPFPSTTHRIAGIHAYELKALSGPGTSITTFPTTITLTISYDPQDVQGLSVSTLKLWRWAGTQWIPTTNCQVDQTNYTLTCTTTNFSPFIMMGEPDTTSPNQITNLSLSNITETSALLSWTAPGDNGDQGIVSFYDIRYLNGTAANFSFTAANIVTGDPMPPKVAFSTETYTLVGLSPNTTYTVAITATDLAGNTGAISNLVEFTTSVTSSSSSGGGSSSSSGGGSSSSSGGGSSSSSGGGSYGDTTPPGAILNLVATLTHPRVSLSWTNPTDSDFVRTRILRKEGLVPPQTSSDGTQVYEGVGTSTFDTPLLTAGKTYLYRAFTFDHIPNYAVGNSATISISAQISTTSPSLVQIPISPSLLTRTLYRGLRHGQVATLQTFLIAHGHLGQNNITGFFGNLTEAAVKQYQCAASIVCGGTLKTTGWGNVGAKTRRQITITQLQEYLKVLLSLVGK